MLKAAFLLGMLLSVAVTANNATNDEVEAAMQQIYQANGGQRFASCDLIEALEAQDKQLTVMRATKKVNMFFRRQAQVERQKDIQFEAQKAGGKAEAAANQATWDANAPENARLRFQVERARTRLASNPTNPQLKQEYLVAWSNATGYQREENEDLLEEPEPSPEEDSSQDVECSICLGAVIPEHEERTPCCLATMHRHCLKSHIETPPSHYSNPHVCPLCRTNWDEDALMIPEYFRNFVQVLEDTELSEEELAMQQDDSE